MRLLKLLISGVHPQPGMILDECLQADGDFSFSQHLRLRLGTFQSKSRSQIENAIGEVEVRAWLFVSELV